jgi:hypothetical protein
MVCEEPEKPGWGCGFGGSEFRILPDDGREVIISHNVWCQGEVPKKFRKVLPDNAIFLEKEKRYA